MTSVCEKIRDGVYTNQIKYPSRPKIPLLLTKKTIDLTDEEIASIPQIKKSYQEELKQCEEQRQAFNKRNKEIYQQFEADLAEEYGFTNHPKRDLLFGKAWSRGSAYGYGEVAEVYDDLADLLS